MILEKDITDIKELYIISNIKIQNIITFSFFLCVLFKPFLLQFFSFFILDHREKKRKVRCTTNKLICHIPYLGHIKLTVKNYNKYLVVIKLNQHFFFF